MGNCQNITCKNSTNSAIAPKRPKLMTKPTISVMAPSEEEVLSPGSKHLQRDLKSHSSAEKRSLAVSSNLSSFLKKKDSPFYIDMD